MGLAGLRSVQDIARDALLMPANPFTIPPAAKAKRK
jgi:hypothetical protein